MDGICLDVKTVKIMRRNLFGFSAVDQPPFRPQAGVKERHADILADRHQTHDPFFVAVVGHVGNSMPYGIERISDYRLFPRMKDLARCHFLQSEQSPAEFSRSGARKTDQAGDLSLIKLHRDVLQCCPGQMAAFHKQTVFTGHIRNLPADQLDFLSGNKAGKLLLV